MDAPDAKPPASSPITLVAAVSAALLAVITAAVAGRGASMMPTAIALGGTAAAFAIIAIGSWLSGDQALVGGAAVGIAATTRWVVVVLLLLGIAAPIVMLIMQNPFLLAPAAAVIEAAAAAGGVGVMLVFVVFALQFPLAASGRRVASEPTDRVLGGQLLGFGLGFAPVLVAFVIGASTENRRIEAAVQHSRDENRARSAEYAADTMGQVRKAQEAPRRVLMQLHACVHTGCIDSLLVAAKRDSIIVRYNPLPRHRYWASAEAGRGRFARRLVTDQTGGLFEWPVRSARDDHPGPDSTDILLSSDTTVREMSYLGDCVWYQFQLYMEPVPRHVTQVCALSGDTSHLRVGSGTDYVVEFLYLKPTPGNRRGDFALSARPAVYGRTDVRSFLIRNEGKDVRVTTENRAARATDQRVDEFEFRTGTIRIATH
jgi:hypothetical protein